MLTCREITELVTSYLDKSMPLSQRLRFRLHISMCRNCRAYLRQMRTTVRTLGHVPAEPVPDDVRDELAQRLARMRREVRDRRDGEG